MQNTTNTIHGANIEDLQPEKIESYIVPQIDKQIRLSDFVAGIFKTITSHKGMKNAIKKGLVKINDKTGYTGDYIRGGETIDLYQNCEPINKPSIDIKLEVIFEDDYLAIVNKPPGIVVSGNKQWTLENALPCNLKPSNKPTALQRPEPIHRLDYPTSGALLIGKTRHAVLALNKLFEERSIEKIYFAVTIKAMPNSGIVESEIENKQCKSIYKVINSVVSPKYYFLNLTQLTPHTGRRHQLRIHMAEIGNPILGDLKYGTEGLILKGKGLYLHSYSLKFVHPFTGEDILVEVPLPKKFTKLFDE